VAGRLYATAVRNGVTFNLVSDDEWELDLHGLTLPVAHAAVRFALRRIKRLVSQRNTVAVVVV